MIQTYNLYKQLKAKDRDALVNRSYLDIMMNTIYSMFNYKCNDKELEYFINLRMEFYLRNYGKVAFTKDDKGKLIFGRCSWYGGSNEYGIPNKVHITTENTVQGHVYERTIGKDAIVIFNNHVMHSELNIGHITSVLSEIDKSEYDLMLNARLHPIIICYDEPTKNTIQNALNNSEIGKTYSVACSGALGKEVLTGGDGIKVINISDPTNAELFQHYAHYHDDIYNRFYSQYGLTNFNTGKMAQVSEDELDGNIISSMSYPMENYAIRKMCIDNINEMLETSI